GRRRGPGGRGRPRGGRLLGRAGGGTGRRGGRAGDAAGDPEDLVLDVGALGALGVYGQLDVEALYRVGLDAGEVEGVGLAGVQPGLAAPAAGVGLAGGA